MTGWLGAAYLWVKAAHVIFIIFFVAGLFILPRHLAYHAAVPPGAPEEALWAARERTLLKVILTPSLVAVWVLGLMLAFNYGFAGAGWLHLKILLVILLTGFHGWLVATQRRMAAGGRPYRERTLKALNEVPAIFTVLIVILAIVKPF